MGNANVERIMRGHVFSKLPKYCVALKPGMLWVRCRVCGKPHQEYFGPKDRDERKAEIVFLRQELEVASSILAGDHASVRACTPGGVSSRDRHR
jgi:hypothetical protein